MNNPRLIIHNKIDTDAFRGLVDFLNDHDGPVTIYLSSSGGDEHIMHCMLDAMTSRVDDITLIGSGHLFSSGFDLFFLFSGKRVLLPSVLGMCHLCRVGVEISETGKMYYSQDEAMRKYVMQYASINTIELLNTLGISEKDRKKILAGDEVYFLPAQMEEFLNNSQKNKKQ